MAASSPAAMTAKESEKARSSSVPDIPKGNIDPALKYPTTPCRASKTNTRRSTFDETLRTCQKNMATLITASGAKTSAVGRNPVGSANTVMMIATTSAVSRYSMGRRLSNDARCGGNSAATSARGDVKGDAVGQPEFASSRDIRTLQHL